MTQHECSRVGCTRLTSEQECDLHAVKMTGVVHPQKEPRPSLTREGFAGLVGTYEAQAYDHGYCEGCASYDDEGLSGAKRTAGRAESRVKATGAALLAAFDSLAAERDEWKRRAEKVDSYTEALKLSRDEQRSRAAKAEAERDAAVRERNVFEQITKGAMLKPALVNGVGGFEVLPVQPDPRIEAWRALDAGDREEVIGSIIGDGAMHRDLHAIWAEEPNDGPDPKFLSMAAAYDAAAAALEALAERP